MMQNVWNNPEGYQRTAARLQKVYLRMLLENDSPRGDVLDVGSGTGNAAEILEELDADMSSYTGVDISPEMVKFARERFSSSGNIKFYVADFLNWEAEHAGKFDSAICAACLHWFYPNHNEVVKKISGNLKAQGTFHLSCAAEFNLLDGEEDIQSRVLKQVRQEYPPIAAADTFATRRMSFKNLPEFVEGFQTVEAVYTEKRLEFASGEDFKDWHKGSGSVVAPQFAPENRQEATERYYDLLFAEYQCGAYNVSYATHLLTLKKD